MRPVRTALELRVELRPHEPAVGRLLHDLHQAAVRGQARQPQPRRLHLAAEAVVELVPMPVALGDILRAVLPPGQTPLRQPAGVLAQPHGAALGGNAHLIGHQVNDGMGRHGGEFGAVGVGPAHHVAGKLDDSDLHPQADAQIRHLMLPCILSR